MAKTPNKNPFDPSEMFKMFDLEKLQEMFDPQALMDQMPDMGAQGGDVSDAMGRNKRNFDAMVAANKSAAETYQSLMARQMEIFNQLTAAAQDYAQNVDTSTEAASKNATAYSETMEKAFGLMQEMAEATRDANEKVYEDTKAQVGKVLDELKKS
ncbi:hypothetical protein ALP8811_02169 [Aliiroseovarius pelagivivens]|uniref:Phasin domain-containing protein n=1 Tax=Aliiroseovarius pelagivivens TaxID=1639690 RepID=A0A2R8AMA0_9RHOB|nr:phasin family protein [Aliiroseovarius pelagivivens]SPF77146.1 hypothetical protein ALP8811_02169 [Aliiroseovarius pelagivivens]